MQINNNNNQVNFQAKFNHSVGAYPSLSKAAKERGIDLKPLERRVAGIASGRLIAVKSRYQKKFNQVLTTFTWKNNDNRATSVITETYKTDDIANSALEKFLEALDSDTALHKKIFLA